MFHVNNLCERLLSAFPSSVECQVLFDELVVEVLPSSYHDLMLYLKTEERFELMVDLCGVDYSAYREVDPLAMEADRFAVVVHLLSIFHNQRVRVRVFCSDVEFPRIQTISNIWSAADWYEREAFDLFGILFDGHLDLRRILTDYGFIGHPFRKDFPISGYVEMQYHQDAGRIMYQPVSIEPRENVPRIIREKHYGEQE